MGLSYVIFILPKQKVCLIDTFIFPWINQNAQEMAQHQLSNMTLFLQEVLIIFLIWQSFLQKPDMFLEQIMFHVFNWNISLWPLLKCKDQWEG